MKGRKWWLVTLVAVIMLAVLAAAVFLPRPGNGGVALPVLMYHHFDETSSSYTVVSAKRFREQMKALKRAGYTAVTIQQLLDYVDGGEPLPPKPILITMDDGYTSNLELAGPILEETGMCATVFVIGVNEGQTIYVHSGNPLYPARFSYEAAAPWVEKGVLDLQSHTFDLHQLSTYGFIPRDGVLPLEGESDALYRQALLADLDAFRQKREGRVDTALVALAYPFGYWNETADEIYREAGIPVTFTIEEHMNTLRPGDADCLRRMGRYNVNEGMGGVELVLRLLLAH